jgi:chromosome segregation ATPase
MERKLAKALAKEGESTHKMESGTLEILAAIEDLQCELDTARQLNDALQETADAAEFREKELEAQVVEGAETMQHQAGVIAAKEQKIQILSARLEASDSERKEAMEKIGRLSVELERRDQEAEEHQTQIDALEATIGELRHAASHEEQRDSPQVQQPEKQAQDLREMLERRERSYHDLRALCDSLQQQNLELHKKNMELERSKMAFDNLRSQMKGVREQALPVSGPNTSAKGHGFKTGTPVPKAAVRPVAEGYSLGQRTAGASTRLYRNTPVVTQVSATKDKDES